MGQSEKSFCLFSELKAYNEMMNEARALATKRIVE